MNDLVQAAFEKACELAQDAGEAFVLSITAAYLAGKAAGRTEAMIEKVS